MHWVKATAPNGRENWINLAVVANIMSSDDGGSIVFMQALTSITATDNSGKPVSRPQYLTSATKESPAELLSMPKFEVAQAKAPVKTKRGSSRKAA